MFAINLEISLIVISVIGSGVQAGWIVSFQFVNYTGAGIDCDKGLLDTRKFCDPIFEFCYTTKERRFSKCYESYEYDNTDFVNFATDTPFPVPDVEFQTPPTSSQVHIIVYDANTILADTRLVSFPFQIINRADFIPDTTKTFVFDKNHYRIVLEVTFSCTFPSVCTVPTTNPTTILRTTQEKRKTSTITTIPTVNPSTSPTAIPTDLTTLAPTITPSTSKTAATTFTFTPSTASTGKTTVTTRANFPTTTTGQRSTEELSTEEQSTEELSTEEHLTVEPSAVQTIAQSPTVQPSTHSPDRTTTPAGTTEQHIRTNETTQGRTGDSSTSIRPTTQTNLLTSTVANVSNTEHFSSRKNPVVIIVITCTACCCLGFMALNWFLMTRPRMKPGTHEDHSTADSHEPRYTTMQFTNALACASPLYEEMALRQQFTPQDKLDDQGQGQTSV